MTRAERRLEGLATTCGPRVLAYLARRTTPREDAADVYQEVLTTVWRTIHHAPDAEAEVLAWMLAIARRTLANHRRATGRRLSATSRLRDELAVCPPPQDEVRGDDRIDDVREAVARLGEDDREVLTLTYWDGLTCDQVAVVVGATAAATRKRLQRARQRLHAALATSGEGTRHTTRF